MVIVEVNCVPDASTQAAAGYFGDATLRTGCHLDDRSQSVWETMVRKQWSRMPRRRTTQQLVIWMKRGEIGVLIIYYVSGGTGGLSKHIDTTTMLYGNKQDLVLYCQ